MNKVDIILLGLATFFVIFVGAILFVFVLTEGNEPTALVTVVGGAIITEIIALCKLKLSKRKHEALKEDKKVEA